EYVMHTSCIYAVFRGYSSEDTASTEDEMTHDAQSVIAELRAALPADAVVTDPASTDAYRWDRALDPNAGVPLTVVRPLTTDQVQAVVRIAAAAGVPVIPRGAGSG